MLVRGGFNTDLLWFDAERRGNVGLHRLKMWEQFRLLGNNRRVHVNDRTLARAHLPRRLFEKDPARGSPPAWIGIGKEMPNIHFTDGTEDRVANCMHKDVGIGVAV